MSNQQQQQDNNDKKQALTDRQLDQVLGCIYGNALGDAIGLATEFMDSNEVKKVFGDLNKKLIDFPNVDHKSYHSIRWATGDWTDDTDQLILIMQSLIANKLNINLQDYAKRLHTWMRCGFPELGDMGGMGIGFTVASVLNHKKFLTEPKSAAVEIWKKHGENLAANGALMRTAILGCMDFDDMDKVIKNTIEFCHVTHADTRCVASCIAITSAIALILQGKHCDSNSKVDVNAVLNESLQLSLKNLDCGKHQQEFEKYYKMTTVAEMQLDEQKAIGYTLKCMSSALYGLRNAETRDFKWIINDIIKEGGDADTNACVCGALIGVQLGYSKLPHDYLKVMPNKAWLDKQVVEFCTLIGFEKSKVEGVLQGSKL